MNSTHWNPTVATDSKVKIILCVHRGRESNFSQNGDINTAYLAEMSTVARSATIMWLWCFATCPTPVVKYVPPMEVKTCYLDQNATKASIVTGVSRKKR